MKVSGELLRFAVVGSVGFLVDASVLTALVLWLDGGLLISRIFSYLAAASVTWILHRHYTFRDNLDISADDSSVSRALFKQWSQFVVSNAVGACLNYGVYAALILGFTWCRENPVIGVAVGSLVAMAFNFTISKRFVFSRKTMS